MENEMIAVIYDPKTGIISKTMQASEAIIAANGTYLPVDVWMNNYDSLYTVQDGKLVPKTPTS